MFLDSSLTRNKLSETCLESAHTMRLVEQFAACALEKTGSLPNVSLACTSVTNFWSGARLRPSAFQPRALNRLACWPRRVGFLF